jgi:aminocarboxymuconate-semialdehyde decarboxylase
MIRLLARPCTLALAMASLALGNFASAAQGKEPVATPASDLSAQPAKAKRIDAHAHLWFDDYLDLIEKYGNPEAVKTNRASGAGPSAEQLANRFAEMDKAGIDLQVLSVTPSAPHFANRERAIEAARLANDHYARLVAQYPERFRAFAAVPLPHVEDAIPETRRALDELGMVGVAITTSILGMGLDDAKLDPFYAELDRRGAVLYVHSAGSCADSRLIRDSHMAWSTGAPLEDTIAATQLILKGIPSRYPNIKIILPHLGGGLPMLLTRIDRLYRYESPNTPELPSSAARRMWYDTVAHNSSIALKAAADAYGTGRLILGTDYPYQKGEPFQQAVTFISDTLPEADARAILDTNAHQLFDLSKPVPAAK